MKIKRGIIVFAESMFFDPKWYHYPFIYLLLPFSFLYGGAMVIRRRYSNIKKYDIPVVSVGNLIAGGSGKTPFVIALALEYQDLFVISRGHGRKSTGFQEISRYGKIVSDIKRAGDEAMLMALSLPNASVLVSEQRHKAIEFALNHGAKIIILDDGFGRVDIDKFDILLEPVHMKNTYVFPAGPLREFMFTRDKADMILQEGIEFFRDVRIDNQTERMLLVTAISNPARLEPYLPKGVVGRVYYEDHAYFDEKVLKNLLLEYKATSILCTSKDRVKMGGFKFAISEMKLKLDIKKEIFAKIDKYIGGFKDA